MSEPNIDEDVQEDLKEEVKPLKIEEVLSEIQVELKAPKGQYNKFGKYSYRSCEDILNALKPFLNKYGAIIILKDEIIEVSGWVYVKSTATFGLTTGSDEISVCAYAREHVDRKGMDVSQITGTASSYARKYALNGLFAIDDVADGDTRKPADKISDEPIDETKVNGAYETFKKNIDGISPDGVEPDSLREVKQTYSLLSNDEILAVVAKFGSDTPEDSRKGYKAILKELIKTREVAA